MTVSAFHGVNRILKKKKKERQDKTRVKGSPSFA